MPSQIRIPRPWQRVIGFLIAGYGALILLNSAKYAPDIIKSDPNLVAVIGFLAVIFGAWLLVKG